MLPQHHCLDFKAAQHAAGASAAYHGPTHSRRRLRRPVTDMVPKTGQSCQTGVFVCAAQRLLADPGAAQGPSTSQAPPTQQRKQKSSQPRGFGKQAKQNPGKGFSAGAEHDDAAAPCACGSGLPYRTCCQQYHIGAATPQTAPDLARARLSALQLLAGNARQDSSSKGATAELQEFMTDTLHPESPWLVGGAADYRSKRLRRDVGYARDMRWRVVGMTHAEGDDDNTWAVLYVLESRHPDYAGMRQPVLELCGRAPAPAASSPAAQQAQGKHKRNKKGRQTVQPQAPPPPQQQGRQDVPLGPWRLIEHSNELPEKAHHLHEFIMTHCPDAVPPPDTDEDEGGESSGEWDTPRPAMQPQGFVRGTPRACGCSNSSNSSSSDSSSMDSSERASTASQHWLVDLLDPSGTGTSAAHSFFVMDDYLAASQDAMSDYLVISAGGVGSAARLRSSGGASAGSTAATIAAGKAAPAAVGQGAGDETSSSSRGGTGANSTSSSSGSASSGNSSHGQSAFGRRQQQRGEVVVVADVPLYEEERSDELPIDVLQYLRNPPVDRGRFMSSAM